MTVVALALATFLLSTNADLAAVKELYASASFDDVLARLESLDTSLLTPEQLAEAHQYRAASLFALGRTNEAELAMEVLVRSAPELSAVLIDGSPRLLTMFSSVRARVLPQIVRELYASAKRAYEDRAADAPAQFERLRKLLDEPPLREGPSAAPFADLRTVVNAFLDLSRAAGPAPSPVVAATPPATTAPIARTRAATTHAATAPATAAPVSGIVYTAADSGVTAPKAIKQVIPRPPSLSSRRLSFAGRAAVEVTIAADGTVERAVVTRSINSIYDAVLLAAARKWQYEPALWNGTPVRFQKTIVIDVKEIEDLPRR